MKRSFVVRFALVAFGLAVLPSCASASIIELGATKTAVTAPTCPPDLTSSECTIILTRSTALETIRDGVAYPTKVKKAGSIVAFTVGLSTLSDNRATRLSDIKYLDHKYRGTTQLAVTVLRPMGNKNLHQWKVVAQSALFHVQPYLGEVVQFPLPTSLPVARGDTVALTTPTWAPVLSIEVSSKRFAYRQSRHANCSHPPGQNQAQMTIGATTRYACDYPGTRVEYSATEVTTPRVPKGYVHARRHLHARRVAAVNAT